VEGSPQIMKGWEPLAYVEEQTMRSSRFAVVLVDVRFPISVNAKIWWKNDLI